MPNKNNFIEQHQAKRTYLVKIGTLVIAIAGIVYTAFYIASKNWVGAIFESIFIYIGYMAYKENSRNNSVAIAHVYFPMLFVAICASCIFLDVPNEFAPRSHHTYLLPMAIYAHVLYQDANRHLKLLSPIVILLAFLIFACTKMGFSLVSMTYEQKEMSTWFVNTVAIVMLYLVVFIMQSDFNVRNVLENEFSNALLKKELELYYQPQVNKHGHVIGAEVLSRWHHPSLGTITPDVFIPIAEKTGLIIHLGWQVLKSSCDQLVIWGKSDATAHLTLSVNMSVKQFEEADFVPRIIALVNDAGIDAHKLQLEITESIFAHNLEDITGKMVELKSFGIKFSLDDFGTGYSSLAYVKNLPLDELKIDKSFIKDVLTSVSDATIAKMIISLALELHIEVIAEGVETIEQLQFLVENGCSNFQGFLYSRALPLDAFNEFVLAHKVPLSAA